MTVGLIGCGNIGADLCIALQKGGIPARVVALTDTDPARPPVLQRSFDLDADICDLEANAAKADFLVECAAASAVKEVVDAAVRHGKGCLILSVGGLLEHPELLERAWDCGVELRVPSGSLCGLDGVRAAMEGGVHRVVLTTRKPPAGFAGEPYVAKRGIGLASLEEAEVLFEGDALEAVRAFPKNVNVAAALSFAALGPKETWVRVIADPKATRNSHEIVAEGAFGRLQAVTENLPSPRNMKSSYLASLSAVAELRAAAGAFAVRHAETTS
jgi:aspartate dehydrogenase